MNHLLSIKDGNQHVLILSEEIVWIEASEQFAYLKLKRDIQNGKRYTTKNSLKSIEKEFCTSGSYMVRVSKSYIVNMKEVSKILKMPSGRTGTRAVLEFRDTHKKISVGRSYKKNIKACLKEI